MNITVRPGDSIWYYSQLFGIPIVLIEHSNRDVNPQQIFPGIIIRIPGYVEQSYTVQPNDSFWTIAERYQASLDGLFLLNPQVNPNQLQIGQIIRIPIRMTQLIVDDIRDYTYEKMTQHLRQLQRIYPFLINEPIGNSVLNKELYEIRVGSGSKRVHINGSFHANEWITTPVIMRFLNEYALALTNNIPIRGLYMLPYYLDVELSLVPMVNPDGVNLVINGITAAENLQDEVLSINRQQADFSNWKANIRGVDLNNQFPALWETEAARKPTTPQPRDFPGYAPLSEPEAIAMANVASNRNFIRMNAFHTQGKVIFWGFQNLEPPEAEIIVNEFARVSGYLPIQFVDSYAGYKDWFIQEFRRPGFTVELGRGQNPLPVEQFPEMYEEALGIFLANLYM